MTGPEVTRECTMFALHGNQITDPMRLRLRARRVDPLDATGLLIATARFVSPTTGWVITLAPLSRQVVSVESCKDEAILRLRRVVGEDGMHQKTTNR
ncbi:hypothetical protein FXW78_25495 [Rhodococcus opacus]|nr:hypothetical protein [Rhodococcus opacus]